MKKITILLILLFSIFKSYCQEKTSYEYGVLIYASSQTSFKKYVLIENIQNQFKSEEGKLEDGTAWTNFLPIINRLEEISKDGWEHYLTAPHTSIGGGVATGTLFFIRRKK